MALNGRGPVHDRLHSNIIVEDDDSAVQGLEQREASR